MEFRLPTNPVFFHPKTEEKRELLKQLGVVGEPVTVFAEIPDENDAKQIPACFLYAKPHEMIRLSSGELVTLLQYGFKHPLQKLCFYVPMKEQLNKAELHVFKVPRSFFPVIVRSRFINFGRLSINPPTRA